MDTRDRIISLEEAKYLLEQAVDAITQALRGTSHQSHAESYIIAHLNNWIDSPGYDYGIQQYIDELEEEGGEEVNEDSLQKMHRAHAMVVDKMKSLAKQYKAGDKSVVPQLKDLTQKKKALESQIEKSVSGIGSDQEYESDN